MNIILGIDDVPAIEDDKCCRCGVCLAEHNFSNWFVFVESCGQKYLMPICNECDRKENQITAKS